MSSDPTHVETGASQDAAKFRKGTRSSVGVALFRALRLLPTTASGPARNSTVAVAVLTAIMERARSSRHDLTLFQRTVLAIGKAGKPAP